VRAALLAEGTKLRTVPGPAAALLSAVVAIAGAALLAGGPDPVHTGLIGVQVAQAVIAVAAGQTLAGEFATGLIGPSLLGVPRRLTLLGAKAAWLVVVVPAASAVAVGAAVAVGRSRAADYPAPLSAAVLRAAGGSVLYLGLIALLGLGVAAAVRSPAATAGVTLGLLFLVPAVLRFFPDESWQRALYRMTPSSAGLTVQTTVEVGSLPIGPWAGLGVAAAWAGAALLVGGLRFVRS
jgi:ABC-2 type transport system permease protein